jgi:twinfilin-like protein
LLIIFQKIDVATETIDLADKSNVTVSALSSTISSTEPRYSFFKYNYSSPDGSSLSPIIFIYTCPTASKIKERMVYASSRSWALKIAETDAGLKVEKKLEMSEPDEISESSIEEEFKPKVDVKKAFDRPKRPGRK